MASFPTRKEDFEHDDRVSYYEEEAKWILEDSTGAEWEWVEATEKWVPALSEEDIAQQQAAYVNPEVDDGLTAEDQFKNKKRKAVEQAKTDPSSKKSKTEKQNSAVYVTSIPLDATIAEIHAVFSKYGLIAEEIDSDKPRIKMYEDSEGKFKGDALVVYFKPESVALAIQLLDESEFRWGSKGPDGLMRVKEADTSYKKQKNEAGQNVGVTGGTAPVKKRGKKGDKQKIIEKTMRLNQRLADWSDDEDGGALLNKEVKKEVKKASKWDKVVILKKMFTLDGLAQDLREDPQAKEYLLEDTKEKCEEFGEVLDLFIFDLEQEGVMTVRFAKAEDAAKCAEKLNGWSFDDRFIEASISTGQRFRKSQLSAEDEEAERRRLDAFAEALENAPDE